jgi:hypothetical protein
MGKLGGQPSLAKEAIVKSGLVGEVLGEHLDGDRPLELRVAS